jgi:hypothetical protein
VAGQHQLGSGEKAVLRPFGATGGPTLGLIEELTARLRPYPSLRGRWLWRSKICGLDSYVLGGEVLCGRDADEMVLTDPS